MKSKSLTLSNVLSAFRDGLDKEATDTTEEAPVVQEVSSTPEGTDKETPEGTDKETPEVKEASDTTEVDETTADVLKGIAKEAADTEATNMKKEASEFGKLFAHSFLEEVEMDNMTKQASHNAYNATIQAIEDLDFQEKLASVYDEARGMTHLAVVQKSAYDTTCAALEKKASENFPIVLTQITKEAYDMTVEAFNA